MWIEEPVADDELPDSEIRLSSAAADTDGIMGRKKLLATFAGSFQWSTDTVGRWGTRNSKQGKKSA